MRTAQVAALAVRAATSRAAWTRRRGGRPQAIAAASGQNSSTSTGQHTPEPWREEVRTDRRHGYRLHGQEVPRLVEGKEEADPAPAIGQGIE